LLLLFGLTTPWTALLLTVDMAVAILAVHFKDGFFMPKGYEFPLTLVAATLALLLAGPVAASVDGSRSGLRPLRAKPGRQSAIATVCGRPS
jgi:putative oxidoreductase